MFKFIRPLLLLSFFVAGQTLAADTPFDAGKFDALQKQGKPTLIAIHADWCPTCKAQGPILSELLKTSDLKGITMLRVDFDNQKDAVRSFKATMQSTLIVFKGGSEVGRSVGDTSKDSIAALLKKAI
jgi:thioredoxin 1